MARKSKYTILHEDDDIVVVNKPPLLLSIPDRYRPIENLSTELSKKHKEIFTVHRLDKDTSGVIVFAKNATAHKSLNDQFVNRTVKKIYWAVLEGKVNTLEGRVDAPIVGHPTRKGQFIVFNKGKKSITNYKVLEQFKLFTLMEFNPETGRTHQLRVHSKHIGHLILCDQIYGKREQLFASDIKIRNFRVQKDVEQRPLIARTCLHAKELTFTHPTTQKAMNFIADLPKDFKATLQQLRKWNAIN